MQTVLTLIRSCKEFLWQCDFFVFVQELANTKACTKKEVQEATDKTQSVEKELKKVRERSQQQLKEVHKDNEKLIKDVKALQEREDIEVKIRKF